VHWLSCPCSTLASFRINFQLFFSSLLTSIFFTSFSTSSNHLFLGFPTDRFSQFFLLIFFPRPNHLTLSSLISQITSGSLYRLINS
jgi:hypothetical protein